jgi:hypothetical protein
MKKTGGNCKNIFLCSVINPSVILIRIVVISLIFCSCTNSPGPKLKDASGYIIPEGYLDETADIPGFWISTTAEIGTFLQRNVIKGQVETIATSPGGRPVKAVFYGMKREGKGTTTFSGACGINNIAPYRGTDNSKTVYLGLGGVHGFELEGIIGIVNLISVFETGKDLNGREWPELISVMNKIDRIILIPLLNPDGRDRVPVRLETHRGASKDSYVVHELLNTGGKHDGTLIGWPDVKEYIPMDFSTVGFPGGYPNDAGVNMMHDDFFGTVQPETRALFDLVADEKPDLIINMHTGAPGNDYYMRMHRPFCEPSLRPVFDSLYRDVHTGLTLNDMQGTDDINTEANPAKAYQGVYNLDCALNLHSGALSVVVEAPSHGFSGTNRAGEPVLQTPEMLLNAELVVHCEAMKFLAGTGGRSQWSSVFKKK